VFTLAIAPSATGRLHEAIFAASLQPLA